MKLTGMKAVDWLGTEGKEIKMTQGAHSGSKDHSGWRLFDGSGLRTTDYFIPFKDGDKNVEYSEPPAVHVALIGLDILEGSNHRLRTEVIAVHKSGFIVRYITWAGTRVWSAAISWLAIGKIGGQLSSAIVKSALGEGVSEQNAINELGR